MTPFRRIAATALSVSALALPLAVVSAPEAKAATRCSITGFSPRSVTVGLTPKVVKFKPTTADCTLEGWSIEGDSFFVYDSNPEEVFDPYSNSETKAQDVIMEAYNEDYESTSRVFADAFRVKRATNFDKFNASPEPVRKGSKITIKGRLRLANWESQTYGGTPNRTVRVEFRTKTGSYRLIKSVKSATGGYVTTTVTAGSDGYWRLRYVGSATTGASAAKGDFVDVR